METPFLGETEIQEETPETAAEVLARMDERQAEDALVLRKIESNTAVLSDVLKGTVAGNRIAKETVAAIKGAEGAKAEAVKPAQERRVETPVPVIEIPEQEPAKKDTPKPPRKPVERPVAERAVIRETVRETVQKVKDSAADPATPRERVVRETTAPPRREKPETIAEVTATPKPAPEKRPKEAPKAERQRDQKGRFGKAEKTPKSTAEEAEGRKETLTLASILAKALKGGVGEKKGDLKDAAGRAVLGGGWDAAQEAMEALGGIKEGMSKDSGLIHDLKLWAKSKIGRAPESLASTETAQPQEQAATVFQPAVSTATAPAERVQIPETAVTAPIPNTIPHGKAKPGKKDPATQAIEKTEKAEVRRHRELVQAVEGIEGGGGSGDGGLSEAIGTAVGLSAGGMFRKALAKVPGLSKMGALVTALNPIAKILGAGAVGFGIGTLLSGLVDKIVEKLTGGSAKTGGGWLYDKFHPSKGDNKKFEEKYQQYQPMVRDAAARAGVSEDFMKTMMKIESQGNPDAVSKTGAGGLYQFTRGTAKAYGIDGQVFEPGANINAAARLTRDNMAEMQKRGIPVNDSNLYLAHQLGIGGKGKGGLQDLLYSQLSGEASSALRRQMDLNGGKGMDTRQYLQKWRREYAREALDAGADPNSMTRGQLAQRQTAQPIARGESPEFSRGGKAQKGQSQPVGKPAETKGPVFTTGQALAQIPKPKRTNPPVVVANPKSKAPTEATARDMETGKTAQPAEVAPIKPEAAIPVKARTAKPAPLPKPEPMQPPPPQPVTANVPGMEAMVATMNERKNSPRKEAKAQGQPIQMEYSDTFLLLMSRDKV